MTEKKFPKDDFSSGKFFKKEHCKQQEDCEQRTVRMEKCKINYQETTGYPFGHELHL